MATNTSAEAKPKKTLIHLRIKPRTAVSEVEGERGTSSPHATAPVHLMEILLFKEKTISSFFLQDL